jgi:hypothetical protein
MIAHILLARPGAGAFERSIRPESEFDHAGTIEITDPFTVAYEDGLDDAEPEREPLIALETIFEITNSYATEMHCAPQYLDQVRAYRGRSNRSLSVGDVVALGESLWFCASTGWDRIEFTPNLISALTSSPEFNKDFAT